jgi:hypothetical protein
MGRRFLSIGEAEQRIGGDPDHAWETIVTLCRDEEIGSRIFWCGEWKDLRAINWGQPELFDRKRSTLRVGNSEAEVRIDRESLDAYRSRDASTKRQAGGRPPESDWPAVWVEICRRVHYDGLKPKQADFIRGLQDWAMATYGKELTKTTIETYVSKLYRAIKAPEN